MAASDAMEVDTAAPIDEALYSRQLYVLGHEAMRRMAGATVLIVGLKGIGVEVAKNVVLGGVKSVTLHDDGAAQLADLSAQFFLTEADVGRPRAAVTAPRLAELNQYVPVTVHSGALEPSFCAQFGIVVVTGLPMSEAIQINEACRAAGASFIMTDAFGLFGYVFCDFGDEFVVVDTNGEEPLNSMVASITSESPGLVTVLDEGRHGLEDGDYVTFSEVKGMEALNGSEPRPVTVKGPYTFTIEDTTGYSKETATGGYVHQVKQKKTLKFKSLLEALKQPEFVLSDFAKFDRPKQLHFGVQALHAYAAEHGGVMPPPSDAAAAREILERATSLARMAGDTEIEWNERLLRNLAAGARGELSPMCAFFGGIAAQEVMKAASGKFTPVQQWLYFDAEEVLLAEGKEMLPAHETAPRGSRYDAQAAVLGWSKQEQISSLRYLLVGAGAIGCEMLKNWAMMGLAAGSGGKIVVTDPDTIEKSNLNRQFLFRPWDVSKAKSETAARAVTEMNPAVQVEARLERLGADTEAIFDDQFWESLSGVCNALDNVQARLYVDQRCVYYQKSLLESGTLGAKGNVQVVVPRLTESYGSSRDPPEKSIPVCTLKHFPNAIEHTIQWARDRFEGLFKQSAEDVNAYLSQPDFLSSLERQPGVRKPTLEAIKSNLMGRPIAFEECVVWARLKFEEDYYNSIAQLIFNFPLDVVTPSGTPFWSGPKRPPAPLQFSTEDELHMAYILSAANLRAFNYGLKGSTDLEYIKKVADSVSVPKFVPKSGVKIESDPKEAENQAATPMADDDSVCADIIKELPPPSSLVGYRLSPAEFEKDQDDNFHIDFITACSNLRARNYKIAEADRHRTKQIAGKIIPAIATTTAMVTGLVCLELLKLLEPNKPIEAYKNSFANLALPFISFSEPIAASKNKAGASGIEWTLWDRFDVDLGRDITLAEFLDHFKTKYRLEVTMISSGVSILYSFFTAKKKIEERLKMKMSELVQTISKVQFKPKETYILAEICCTDENDDDVEVPCVRYKFRDINNLSAETWAVKG